jgi:hypothetical protein
MRIRALFAALLLASGAAAHTLPVERRALASARLEGGALHVDVMLWMHTPKGAEVERLVARFDLKRDGRLEPAEAKLLADEQSPAVIGGFVLLADGKPVKPAAAEASARLEPNGALSSAVLLSYALPAAPVRLALTLRAERGRHHHHAVEGEWSVLPPLVQQAPAPPAPIVPGGPGLAVRVAPPPPRGGRPAAP